MKNSKLILPLLAALVLAFGLTLSLWGCAQTQGSTQSGSSAESSSSASASSGLSKLAIIHTNDTHGFDQAADGVLGMSAVAQLKTDYAEKGYEVLLFDVGDALSGSLLADDSHEVVAEVDVDVVGLADVDAVVPGSCNVGEIQRNCDWKSKNWHCVRLLRNTVTGPFRPCLC